MFSPDTYAGLDVLTEGVLSERVGINQARYRELKRLARLAASMIYRTDGTHSMLEWVQSRLDVPRSIAADYVYLIEHLNQYREVEHRLGTGEIGIERAAATIRLARAGASPEVVAKADHYDLAGLRRVTAQWRSQQRRDEQTRRHDRYLVAQPTLDGTGGRITAELTATDFDVIQRALHARADSFPTRHAGRSTLSQRLADALVSIAQDSFTTTTGGTNSGGGGGSVTVFVDAAIAAPTRGEAGAVTSGGLKVGPAVLESILCTGAVGVVYVDDGVPVATTPKTRAIPPAIREFVLSRDGGCTMDGCNSHYRLQPHHITPHSEGGTHHPDNLTTLCWFHHHIQVHDRGQQLDPTTPPTRRRFLRGQARPPPIWAYPTYCPANPPQPQTIQ